MATIEEYAEEMFKIFDTVDSVEEQTNALAELRDRMGADIGMVKEAHTVKSAGKCNPCVQYEMEPMSQAGQSTTDAHAVFLTLFRNP